MILRMREGVLAHFRWERDRWRRRVNTRVPRGAVHVAVASVVLPAHAVGGVPEEFVFSCYEADGRDHLIQMGYDARGDLWHVIEGDIPGRAGSPPVGDVRPGRSLAAVVESVPIPGGGESASIVRLAYPTREPGLSTVAVARLDSRTRTWAADTVGVVAGAYLGVSHIGRSGNDRLCIVGGDGRLDWLVGYTPWTVRRYCLSDRTGMPRGWSYRPGHRPHPRES